MLAPPLPPGTIVVLATLSAPTSPRVRALRVARAGAGWSVPASLPDLPPIAAAGATRTQVRCTAAARTREALIEASASAVAPRTAVDTHGFFAIVDTRS